MPPPGDPWSWKAAITPPPGDRMRGPAIDRRARMTEPASRLTATPSDEFADLENEQNFIELGQLSDETRDPVLVGQLLGRLERWGEYYQRPDHRGEIYDIMENGVLPAVRDALQGQPVADVRMGRGRAGYLSRGGDITIVATQLEMYAGVGAGSYAPHEPEPTRTIRVMAYDGRTARLRPGPTWGETNGETTSVEWFGIEDLILWPKLAYDLARMSTRIVPRIARVGAKATIAAGKIATGGTKKLIKAIASPLRKRSLALLEKDLAELASVQVKLGARAGTKGFGSISGKDAVRQLFAEPIGTMARLTEHWPTDLATQYRAEIQKTITDGVKGTRLAKEVAGAFAGNGLTKELLGKLPQRLQDKVKHLVEARWDSLRKAFWRNVFDDGELVAELNKIKLRFAARGNAPVMRIGTTDLKITLDHVARKVENPLEAFEMRNLRAATSKDNSVLKEALVRDIKELSGLDLDAFEALAPGVRQKLPAGFAEELAEKLDAMPSIDDVFEKLGWVNPKAHLPGARVVR